jgi:predicted transglutaminase-like cysteine proteinase
MKTLTVLTVLLLIACTPAQPIKNIHTELLSHHTYLTDQKQYGVNDKWVSSLTGDCEDFSLFSYFLLVDKGYEPQFWLVRTEKGGMHTVIVVDGYEFDSARKLRPILETNYTYLAEIKRDALIKAMAYSARLQM